MNELIKLEEIKAIPARVDGLDFVKAKSAIEEKLSVYKQMVVTDDNIPAIKKTIAGLRSESKDLNDIKIKIKKELTKNVTEMETEFKSLISIYDEAISPLDSKVKKFEQEEYAKRRESVLKTVQDILNGTSYTMNDLDVSEKLFLKSTGDSYISEDINEQIRNLNEKVSIIKDTISNKNQILGKEYHSLSFYEKDLKKPIQEILVKIDSDFRQFKQFDEMEKMRREKELAAETDRAKRELAEKASKAELEKEVEPEQNLEVEPEKTLDADLWMEPIFSPVQEAVSAPWDIVDVKKRILIDESDFDKTVKLLKENNISFTVS